MILPVRRYHSTTMFRSNDYKEHDFHHSSPTAGSTSPVVPNCLESNKSKHDAKYSIDWKLDKEYPTCFHCQSTFSIVRRRHHCRKCGHIFCGKCTSTKIAVEGSKTKNVSVNPASLVPRLAHNKQKLVKQLNSKRPNKQQQGNNPDRPLKSRLRSQTPHANR